MLSKKCKVLVLDMDGTLLNSNKEISYNNKKAVQEILKKDIKVVLASGRNLEDLMEKAEELGINHTESYLIAHNGQYFYDIKNHTLIKDATLPNTINKDMIDYAKNNDLECFGICDEYKFFYSPSGEGRLFKTLVNSNIERASANIESMDKICFFFTDGRDDYFERAEEIRMILNDSCQLLVTDKTTAEIVPNNVDKVNGVNRIKDILGYKNEDFLIIGDGENDIKMSKNYPFVAMKNAFSEVKENAIRITLSNDDDGVAHEINYIIDEINNSKHL